MNLNRSEIEIGGRVVTLQTNVTGIKAAAFAGVVVG